MPIVDMADTPERRKSVSFLDYLIDYSVFFTLRDNVARFPNVDALCGRRVAAVRGTTWPAEIVKWSDEHCTKAGKPAVAVVDAESSPDVLLQVNQGRVDAGVSGYGTMGYQNTLENNRYVAVAKFSEATVGFAFAKDDPEFGQALNKALAAPIAEGTYKKLLHKWNLPDDDGIERPMINGEP